VIERVHSGSQFEPAYGFCRALRIGDRLEVAGTAPIPPAGEGVEPAAHGQMLRCAAIAKAALGELAPAWTVLRTRMFITDPADADEIGRAHAEAFGADDPVATMVVVAELLDPSWRVELEVEAVAESA
jgi:enamine deaminase RidA (YjgF/YER057c/UK114 family)